MPLNGQGKQKIIREIKALASMVDDFFQHVRRLVNKIAYFFAKVGVDEDHEYLVLC